ncbi:MAG: Coenzyme F420 hydrogenase/dehydrogenase, beta subunit C-terminal domain [Lachnospiraceae bacterium]|nr:Coenzyme F420 hydrogenase/dehydrogenase, beta subunit C-terminal domain [Lachnospiraceae bacterium]
MTETIQNINSTTEEGLCTSCGICAAVCPTSCIHFERQKETYLPVIDDEKCIRCGKCLKVCPGYSYTYHAEQKDVPACFSVQAKDKRILKNASSGGLVTAMIRKLLQDGQYHIAFLVTDYNYEEQMETKPFYKGDSLQRSQQSRYLPVSQEKAVKYILENPAVKVIFVGTSCAVHGLCNALKANGRSREKILIVGLFCNQAMTYSIYEYMKRLKHWNSPVRAFHFRDKRAGGWTGNIRLEFQDGTHVHLPAREKALVSDFCRQERCLYCMDKLNVEADLSVGDNYTKKNDSSEGSSNMIVRTALGRKAWEYCMEEFAAFDSEYADIKSSQHIDKRLENQWMNNLLFAKKHGGRTVEDGIPSDLASFDLPERKVTKKVRRQYDRQLADLKLGERHAYALMRWKRIIKFGEMCCGWLLVRLHFYRRT